MGVNLEGSGTPEQPWALKTPSGQSDFQAFRDEDADPPALVVIVGEDQTRLPVAVPDRPARDAARTRRLDATRERGRAEASGRWTVEAWARSPGNPVGGWYGLKKGLRGRFGNDVPPVMEALALAEVEHNPRNNRMRAR